MAAGDKKKVPAFDMDIGTPEVLKYGAEEAPNLDLTRRPYVENPDGAVSTVRSMGVGLTEKDGRERQYLIPTVSHDGRLMDGDEAFDYFKKTGEHMGVYPDIATSDRAGEKIHLDQMNHPPKVAGRYLQPIQITGDPGNQKAPGGGTPDSDGGASLMARLTAMAQGAGQGATRGWNDEGAAKILSMLGGPDDPKGYGREYAAGSQEADNLESIRNNIASAQAKYPRNFSAGEFVGAIPGRVAAFSALPAGMAVGAPAAGLAYGLEAGVDGAGKAEEGGRLRAGAEAAGPAAAMAVASEFAPSVVQRLTAALKGGGGPGGTELTPALATAGARSVERAPASNSMRPGGIQINRADQTKLPGVSEPSYSYHATPKGNAKGIAEVGLRPEQGGKNFDFSKNRGRVYMSDETHAPMWKQKLEDVSGEPALELRTPLSSKQVPGANAAVRIREDAIPPDRLQYKSPEGQWKGVKDLLGDEPVVPTSSSQQSPLNFEQGNAIRPTSSGSQSNFPAIPKQPKLPSHTLEELESGADVPDLEKRLSQANQRLMKNISDKNRARGGPIDRDLEYYKSYADEAEAGVAKRAAETAEEAPVTNKTPLKRFGKKKKFDALGDVPGE